MSKLSRDTTTPQSLGGKTSNSQPDSSHQQSQFVGMALTMGWQLAIAVLLPVIAGVELDKVFNTSPILLWIGLVTAVLASIAVMWRTMQVANNMPVPKLTEAQRKAIRKQYEEDDEQ